MAKDKEQATAELAARLDSRKVNQLRLEVGQQKFAISGPGMLALRVIRRDETGLIQFDKPAVDPAHPNPFSRAGVKYTTQNYDNLLGWLNGYPEFYKAVPNSGFPAEGCVGMSAEIEFEDSRGWVSPVDGVVNVEPFVETEAAPE